MRRQRFAAAAVLLALAGCAGDYGSIRLDADVGRDFEKARVLPAHRYYATGPEYAPDALLALRDDRPLRSGLWREVPMTPALLARLVERMRGARDPGPFGSAVLDNHGTLIGAWYSYLRPLPVKVLGDGGVVISPPLRDEGDSLLFHGSGKD